jgi:2-polyprenyl-3-methyl-5-hydroxy-6-metoxy-1,4-benzoquinol methylase
MLTRELMEVGGGPERVYRNQGNAPLLAMLDHNPEVILDVGCGAGDNGRLLRSMYPQCRIHGITHSSSEAAIARQWMTKCWIFDIEGSIPDELRSLRFDAIIFSHVLEHLRDPAAALRDFSAMLVPGGRAVIAVPNTLSWPTRWRFLRGRFEYTANGVLDETHLRFFTYLTADRYLLSKAPTLQLASKGATGNVPLWWLRRYVLPRSWSRAIDVLGCRLWPNLFGDQVLLKAVRTESTAVGRAQDGSLTHNG